MRKNLLLLGFLFLITLVAVLYLDRPFAIWINDHLSKNQPFLRQALNSLEIIFGFGISKFLLGFVLLATALVVWLVKKSRQKTNIILFIALSHITSRLVAGVIKNFFNRSRPFEFLENRQLGDFFVQAGGSSFPSGHVAYFFGLFLPLFFLFPKYKFLFLVIPIFVSIERIVTNDHYPGDVLFSAWLSFLFTIIFKSIFIKDKNNFSILKNATDVNVPR